MKMHVIAIIVLSICIGFLIYFNKRVEKIVTPQFTPSPSPVSDCIPTFADGGGPYYLPNSPFRNKLTPETTNGEKLVIAGKLLQNDCQTTISNAVIDIWQADEQGNYVNDWYRGQIKTDIEGKYTFETIVPKGYGEGTGYRPPHIHFKVFVENKEIITSQMFFPEIQGTPGFDDAYIMKVESKEENGKPVHIGYHNIILP